MLSDEVRFVARLKKITSQALLDTLLFQLLRLISTVILEIMTG